MAKYQFKGMEEYARYLQRIGQNSRAMCGTAIYAMADIIADEVKKNIEALPSKPDSAGLVAYKKGLPAPITESEKDGLLKGFGIAKMRNENGFWNVKLGFQGYNSERTQKYPIGQPNTLIARSIESGSSFRKKHPFIRPAIRAKESAAVQAAKAAVDKRIFDLERSKK